MILTFLLFIFSAPVDTNDHIDVELKALASDSKSTPFWMRSLQYGSVPLENPGLGTKISLSRTYNPLRRYDWKYGLEVNTWVGSQNTLFLTEAYISGRRGGWELWAGRKKEVYGLGDTTLTSGFYAWSGNALPMPKIQLGTPGYLNIFNQWIGLKMSYAHGYFDNRGPLENVMLHQKSLYGRIGRPDSRLNLFGGLNHQVQWGGNRIVPLTTKRAINVYPSSLNTYFYVVTVLKNKHWVAMDPNTTSDDTDNQYGNHLGSFDIAAEYKTHWGRVLFYKQTAYEQGAAFNLTPADDGLTGLSVRLDGQHLIEGVLVEHLYTGNQGLYRSWIAKLFNTVDTHNGEKIEYMYNGARSTGWWYQADEIGTPLIMRDTKTIQGGNQFTYNAVNVIYLGMRGHITEDFDWVFRGSRSIQTHLRPSRNPVPTFQQQSYSLRVNRIQNERLTYSFHVSYDQGEMLAASLGFMVSARYQIK
ncbi:capsule assembly Wzi family protein [Aquirufa regiilacus]|uniref:Capsule assembly Wzi family protein n=1 Tax=Aquirufa regiilacus TaxID=3024868 RepID=A0ABU3TSP0_9BACT|nr:capsule assembly Wzi family protein [Aquirufa sp. LEOWEIH-7C]MDU0808895.1 capsule assembly Wzi family protein [Aquirufa sp. LEOWEIH-7C]